MACAENISAIQETTTTSRASNAKSVAGCGSLFPANSIKSNAFFGDRLRIDSILYNIAMTSKLEDVQFITI
jgi:hypothetical protein